mmetsp:Transcript_19119/g.39576  ORF Transcript_19119/g.39576 Transcript_19119/m.39576 type:complete len:262 (+) Transcript_19119:870-1655(+)
MVDQMPCNSTIKEDKEESKDGRTGSNNWDPSLSIEIRKVNKPISAAICFALVRAFIREECGAATITALKAWLKFVGYIQLFSVNIREEEFVDTSHDQDRHGHSKIIKGASDTIIAEERSALEVTEHKDQGSCSKTKDGGQQSNFHVVVVFIFGIVFMGRMVGIKVSKDTNIREWITHSIKHKDTDNQKGKDLVGESCGQTDHTGQVKECSRAAVKEQPARNPSLESDKWDINVFGNADDSLGKGKHRTGGSNDAHRHTANQ